MDDEGPFRSTRPTDRRAATRPEPVYRQPDAPQSAKVEPVSAAQSPTAHRASKKTKSPRRFKFPLIILLVVILAAVGFFIVSNMNSKDAAPAINKSQYQAVFFTNGQVYFGKLSSVNSEYLKLTDIYYLQTASTAAKDANPQQTSTDDSTKLIKLGDEIHGPEDQMVISKDQVLFYENLKNDGKVAQSIESYKKSH